MTLSQRILTIALCAAATMLARFLPFFIFSPKRPTPDYIRYLGGALPCAVFAMLIIYCLKNVSIFTGARGIPEAIAIAVTIFLHRWRKQMLLSIAGGTVCYMLLIQFIIL